MNPQKRAALDFKQNISMMAHEFVYECGYIEKYLEDSFKLVKSANHLSADAGLYSIETDDYFWSVNHTFYFSCSFISMLMQIAEDHVNQYAGHWSLILSKDLIVTLNKPFYEKVKISLLNNAGLNLKSSHWEDLSSLYQLRNAFIHQNGILNHRYPDRVKAIKSLTKFKGIMIDSDRVIINELFCAEALNIFRKSLNDLFKSTNRYINDFKKTL